MLIVLLPWGAGDWQAALPLGGGRWQAGAALMQRDSPASFDKIARLYKGCGEQATALCEAAITMRSAQAAERDGTRAGSGVAPPQTHSRVGR